MYIELRLPVNSAGQENCGPSANSLPWPSCGWEWRARHEPSKLPSTPLSWMYWWTLLYLDWWIAWAPAVHGMHFSLAVHNQACAHVYPTFRACSALVLHLRRSRLVGDIRAELDNAVRYFRAVHANMCFRRSARHVFRFAVEHSRRRLPGLLIESALGAIPQDTGLTSWASATG